MAEKQERKTRSGFVGLLLWTGFACGGSESPATPEQRDEGVARVVVTPASVELVVGDTVTLVASVTGTNGTSLTDRAVRWSSSDPTTVSISDGGAASALQPGQATITATAEGRSGTAVVTVAAVPVARIAVSTDSARLAVRTSLHLTAVTLSAAGDTLAGRSIEWTSSDTAVAVVTPAGTVITVGAGTATVMASSESREGSTVITVDPSELEVRGLYVQFERRGWPSGYWSGDVIKQFTQFDDVVGHTVAEEVSQQLDAMRDIGVNTITFELRSTDTTFIRGPREFPECNVSPHLGLLWPNPEAAHLANLVSFLDLVQSKDMGVLLRLVNTRMDDRYRAESEMWLGSILTSIRGHPALELVLFEGDERYHDTDGDGVGDACGGQAEPPLWFGPAGIGARYVEWAIAYALSLGLAPRKLSAEAVIGVFVIDQGPDLQFTPGVMKTIFDRVGIQDDQRTYAISFYQGRRCRFTDGLPCEDADPHDWTDESLLRTLHAIGLESSARIIAPEFSAAAPIEAGWGSAEALESAVELMQKRGIAGGSFWRWTSFEDEQDADATLWEPVKRRGRGYLYTRVREVMRRLYGG